MPKKVTEDELRTIIGARDEVAVLRSRLASLEKELSKKEESIIERLKLGAHVEGGLTASVQEEEGQRRPAWKELYLNHFSSEHGLARGIIEAEARANTQPVIRDVLQIAVLL